MMKIPVCLLIYVLFFASVALALPANVAITELAGKSGDLAFPAYSYAAINNNGQACFKGADLTKSAIIQADGVGPRERVASTDEGSGLFSQFLTGICSINDGGEVAFDGCRKCKAAIVPGGVAAATDPDEPIEYGVYKRVKSGASFISVIIQESALGPTDFKQVSLPSINLLGEVAFSGTLNNGTKGIWIKSGPNLFNPFDSSGIFDTLGGVHLNDSRQVTFGAQEDAPNAARGIYGPSGIGVIGSFNGFGATSLPVINNSGAVAVMARSSSSFTPLSGVYIDGQPLVQSGGDFADVDLSSFQAISQNDRGDVVFPAFRSNGDSVIFAATLGGMLPLIETGEFLPGYASPVSFATVGREAINNQRQVVLVVALEDETQVVLRLDPIGDLFPVDQCPSDNTKFDPGICGCGRSDVDTNGDGTSDCQVTQVARDLAQQISSGIKQLKILPSSAKKAKKQLQKQLRANLKAWATQLRALVQSSESLLILSNQKAKPAKLAASVRSKVVAALGKDSSRFPQNKKLASSAVKKFLNALG